MTLTLTNGWHLLASLGDPSKFQRLSRLGLVTAVMSLTHQRATKLCMKFGRLLGCYTIYTFLGGSCPLTEFCPVQNSLYVQVLRSPILAVLLYGTHAAGVSAKLCGVVQGMEWRNFCRGRHLYLAGRLSCWASAHILVIWGVKLSLIHSWQSYRNVEVWILCNVLFVCMVLYLYPLTVRQLSWK